MCRSQLGSRGMALSITIGTALGVALGNIGVGLALGAALDLAFSCTEDK